MAFTTGASPSELGVRIWQNCRNELYSLFPQLDGAFASLAYAPDPAAEGTGTDGDAIRFPPLELLRRYGEDPAAVRRGYLHMLLHCLYLHPFPEDPPPLWDLACDMAVERVIEGAAVPRLALPDSPVRRECFRVMGDSAPSAARLAGMLEDGAFPFPLPELEAAFRFDSHALWRGIKDRAAAREKWSAAAAGAGRGGYRRGTVAGNVAETVRAPRRGTYDYREFLRRFTAPREELLLDPESFDQIFYHFGLETYGDLPLIEPLEYQEVSRLAELVIAIDTSGSCSTETVRRFLGETLEIVSRRENFFREMKVYLIQCDCLVQSVTVIRSPEEWRRSCEDIVIQGRGGTDFTPVFRYVEELRRKKELKDLRALLYFTDGDGVYPREPTDYETAFVFLRRSDKMDYVPRWATRLLAEGLTEGEGL